MQIRMTNLQQIKLPKICVYKITSPSKKIYIGSTINFKHRMASYNRLDCNMQVKLLNSFKKYGVDKHRFDIVCECELADLRQKEAYYGNLYNTLGKHGLNLRLPNHGEGFNRTSDETRRKIGLSKIGNKNALGRKHSPEAIEKLRIINKNRIRVPHKEATRQKMSDSAMGGKNHKAIILLNIETGIYYECFQDAAASLGMKYNTFRSRMFWKRETRFVIA